MGRTIFEKTARAPAFSMEGSSAFSVRLFTVADYHLMGEVGLLGEDDRVELIDGRILEMSPMGSLHAACVSFLNRRLSDDGTY